MATIAAQDSGNFRVQFRVKNLKIISTTFPTKREAQIYLTMIDRQIASIFEAEKAELPIDMAALYATLHPHLKEAAKHLPVFTRVIGRIASQELTLSMLMDDFMRQYNRKDNNIINRLKWWSDHYGHIKIEDISEDHIRHGINTLLTVGCTGVGVSPQTTNRYKANISSVFEFGKEKYHLKANPCRQIKSKPEGKGRQRYLTIDQQRRFLAAAKKSRWNKFYLLILIAITTGARRSEIMKLTYDQIFSSGNIVICKDTKNGTDKILFFTDIVKNELEKFRQLNNELVFGNPRRPYSPYDFRKEWSLALQEAGIDEFDESGEKIVFHSLRHSFCSTLANMNIETHHIAKLAGHKSLQTTMRYIHGDIAALHSVVGGTFGSLS